MTTPIMLHPTQLPELTQETADDLAWEHAMLTWDQDDEDGIADYVNLIRVLYGAAADSGLFWGSMALHMLSGIAASGGISLPLPKTDSDDEQEAVAVERLLALADGVRGGLITTWVTSRLLGNHMPTDVELRADGVENLAPIPMQLAFRTA